MSQHERRGLLERKWESRFWEIARGLVRTMFSFLRRQDGGSPCGGRGATARQWEVAAARSSIRSP